MKYRLAVVMALGLGMLAAPISQLRADDNSPAPQREDTAGSHWGHNKEHKGLELTKEQKEKLEALMKSEREAIKPLRRKQRDLRIKLADQIEDKAGDSDIKATLADLKANRKALMEQVDKFRAEKETILTPTQQAKMMLWMSGHRGMEMGNEKKECKCMKGDHGAKPEFGTGGFHHEHEGEAEEE